MHDRWLKHPDAMPSTVAVNSILRRGGIDVRSKEVTTLEEATSFLQLHVMSQGFRPDFMFLIALNAVLSIEGSARRGGFSRKNPVNVSGARMRTFCPVPVPETEHSLIPIVLDVGNRKCDK
jgi:hypothetical protein